MVSIVDKRGTSDQRKTHASTDAEPVTSGSDGSEASTGTAIAVGEDATTQPPRVVGVTKADPASVLIDKVFRFCVEQPEFYYVLQLSRNERKLLAKHIAKTMTTFPHFQKTRLTPNGE